MFRLNEKTLKFENYNRSFKIPFVIYFDFDVYFNQSTHVYHVLQSLLVFTNCYQKHVSNNGLQEWHNPTTHTAIIQKSKSIKKKS